MKQESVQKSFVDKLVSVRKLLALRFSQLDLQNLVKIMNQLAHYHYNREDALLVGESRELYGFLIEQGYNPFTVYRWLLLEKLPEDIRFQIKERRLSQKRAVSEAFQRRHETASSIGASIKEMGLGLIRRM